jgi:branched-chain amino acid transport system permease protein
MKHEISLNPVQDGSTSRLAITNAWRLPLAVVAVGLASLAPWWLGAADLRLCVELFILIAIAQMWNLLGGYAGIIVVGPQAFIGFGAYALFWTSNYFGMNPFLALPLAGLATAVVARIFAPLLFRLRGPYFAIGTWVLAEIFRIAVLNTDTLGAGAGMSLEQIGTMERWTRNAVAYWCALAAAVGVIGVLSFLFRSHIGAALTAIRDDDMAAQSLGVNVELVKRILFISSAAVIGMAGGVYYINVLHISPDAAFSMNWTAYIIFVVIIGGLGTLAGPVVGGLIFLGMRETLANYGAPGI